MLRVVPSTTSISVEKRVVLPFTGTSRAGDFSGDENTPSMFSTPKLSLVFSGNVRPVLLHSCQFCSDGSGGCAHRPWTPTSKYSFWRFFRAGAMAIARATKEQMLSKLQTQTVQ